MKVPPATRVWPHPIRYDVERLTDADADHVPLVGRQLPLLEGQVVIGLRGISAPQLDGLERVARIADGACAVSATGERTDDCRHQREEEGLTNDGHVACRASRARMTDEPIPRSVPTARALAFWLQLHRISRRRQANAAGLASPVLRQLQPLRRRSHQRGQRKRRNVPFRPKPPGKPTWARSLANADGRWRG